MAQISVDGGANRTSATGILEDQLLAPHWTAIRAAMDPAVVASVEARLTEEHQRHFLNIYLTEAPQDLILTLPNP